MLAKVAERIYWLSRYMERAENTARMASVYSNLLLDLPRGTKVGWDTMVDILGSKKEFSERYNNADERNVCRFLLAERANTSSIYSSLTLARENARTTREIMPAEAWELINHLYLYIKEEAGKGTTRSGRQQFLIKTISACQQLTGLLSGTMSNNHAYDFVLLGRNIERADMTSRIINIGAANLIPDDGEPETVLAYENTLWMNVLRSLHGYQMYRQHVRDRINAEDVVGFILLDKQFPRAISCCLQELVNCARKLPRNEECLRTITANIGQLQEVSVGRILHRKRLNKFIDTLQLEFAAIHNSITQTWFLPAAQLQTQTQSQSQTTA
jgi:uncharacterized alpha-E superfamily protein